MNPYYNIELPKDLSGPVPSVIEISRDSKCKYEIMKDAPYIKLDRILHSSVHYPTNYGFIPQTIAEDGDALDVLVLCLVPLAPGVIVDTKAIGMLKMRDDKGIDNKIIAVSTVDPRYRGYTEISELSNHYLDEITEFFRTYKSLEHGKKVDIYGYDDSTTAINELKKCVANYQKDIQPSNFEELGRYLYEK